MQTGKQVQSAGNYALTSGETFGILEQMKETFDANLSQTQKEGTENQKAYEDLKAAKDGKKLRARSRRRRSPRSSPQRTRSSRT